MNTEEILELLKSNLNLEINLQTEEISPAINIQAPDLQKIMAFLYENETASFDTLMSQTAMQVGEDFRLFWHLFSYKHRHELTVETKVPLSDPKVHSVTKFWKIADWLERETYDLFGIDFIGHPDLRRLMLPEDWLGHPLRKDYQRPEQYNEIDNSLSAITRSFIPDEKEKKE